MRIETLIEQLRRLGEQADVEFCHVVVSPDVEGLTFTLDYPLKADGDEPDDDGGDEEDEDDEEDESPLRVIRGGR